MQRNQSTLFMTIVQTLNSLFNLLYTYVNTNINLMKNKRQNSILLLFNIIQKKSKISIIIRYLIINFWNQLRMNQFIRKQSILLFQIPLNLCSIVMVSQISYSKQQLLALFQSIQQNSGCFQHILKYISILMRSCKKNKKGEYKNNINYKTGMGTKILNYLLSNLTKFTEIVQTIYYSIIKASNTNVGQYRTYTEIYHKITYIIYMIFWLIDEKEMLRSDPIQQLCLELCYIHYKFTINLIIVLQNAGILQSNTLYQIINNINVIAYGYDYIIQIKDMYFDRNENLLNTSDLFSKLNQRQVLLKLVYNKFYETSLKNSIYRCQNCNQKHKFPLSFLFWISILNLFSISDQQEIQKQQGQCSNAQSE
ncbi:unnamed protein product (macronuclear) [Paramecium tetraurelia]|uniref:Transmembrane protein n=1 Tax=Paramecium tetraurelia TaxID=5888 RepID=A0DMC5_PARTE|nr:uncharacterized protein GSPATT00018410001 [Paramecium tetraurelia]CAK84192.1 unnamed protein product [Paramecium tetraurelia]|eukprot:XP_001451589.1 hypothetical protein (macronuclear) [Paramecium tetraurelia strain d4-2]